MSTNIQSIVENIQNSITYGGEVSVYIPFKPSLTANYDNYIIFNITGYREEV